MSRIEQIRRAHASARPKGSNPAWQNTHGDLSYVLSVLDELSEAGAYYFDNYCQDEADGEAGTTDQQEAARRLAAALDAAGAKLMYR